MPTDERVRQIVARAMALFTRKEDTAFIADDRLQKTTLQRLDRVVSPPACGPVLEELEATIDAWRAESPTTNRFKTILLPPCDQNDVVANWARSGKHEMLLPPKRSQLQANSPLDLPDLTGNALLVVPTLERWFLRTRDGLGAVRDLLRALDAGERPCVIGCNSWAWSFLNVAAGIDQLLPAGVTFRAFDADRLRGWFSELARDDMTRGVRFRLSKDGLDVLGDEAGSQEEHDFFARLAGRSRSIPWVAWHLWRRSLRTDREAEGEDTVDDPGKDTMWIAALDELTLPGHHPQTALLAFHALLIHGGLTDDELRQVMPAVGEPGVIAGLVSSGFLERVDGEIRCRAAAYPAIRSGLVAAGLPKDDL